MRTLLNNSVTGFRADGAFHKPATWRAEPAHQRLGQIGLAKTTVSFRSGSFDSQPIPPDAQTPELPDDDFPFSALIRLVRQMRQ